MTCILLFPQHCHNSRLRKIQIDAYRKASYGRVWRNILERAADNLSVDLEPRPYHRSQPAHQARQQPSSDFQSFSESRDRLARELQSITAERGQERAGRSGPAARAPAPSYPGPAPATARRGTPSAYSAPARRATPGAYPVPALVPAPARRKRAARAPPLRMAKCVGYLHIRADHELGFIHSLPVCGRRENIRPEAGGGDSCG